MVAGYDNGEKQNSPKWFDMSADTVSVYIFVQWLVKRR